jgi:hypothetical protein
MLYQHPRCSERMLILHLDESSDDGGGMGFVALMGDDG